MTRLDYELWKDGAALFKWGGDPYHLWYFDSGIPGWKRAEGSALSSRPALPISYEQAKEIALRKVEQHNPEGLDDLDFGPPDYEYDPANEDA